jgi:hypothetical protein
MIALEAAVEEVTMENKTLTTDHEHTAAPYFNVLDDMGMTKHVGNLKASV